jgi:hypothetical protein
MARRLGILDREMLQDYLTTQGVALSVEAFDLARQLWETGDDYATIAHEIAFRNLQEE